MVEAMPTCPLPTTADAPPTTGGDGITIASSTRPDRGRILSRPSADLAIAAQSGDPDAAGELFRRLRDRARRAACACCADGDADDAVAEGLSRALGRIGQLRDPAAVEGWMLRCVVRAAVDLSRQRQRQPPTDAVDRLVEAQSRLRSGESAAEAALSALDRDSMGQAVRGLRPDLVLLLCLRYQAGLSVQHIASALGRPAGTVRRQCVEARQLVGQRFLGRHLRPAIGDCAEFTRVLCQRPYRRPAVRVQQRTAEHLRRCRSCQDRATELDAVLTELGCRRDQRSA
jgi:RNA polymerase sigma-70 factor (ECF subfamily)